MVCQELATIKHYDFPLIVPILNNRILGMVYQWQYLLYDNRISQTKLPLHLFVKLAESFGINAIRVEKPGETEIAIKKAIKDNESLVLDIAISKDDYLLMVPPGAPITEMIGEYKLENGD